MEGEREPEGPPGLPRAGPRPSPGDDLVELRDRVAAAVRRNCPSWMRAEVEDLAQNVLLKLLRARERSEGGRSFSTLYLEKSAHGAVVDEIRRVCRRREDAGDQDEVLARTPAVAGDPHRSSSAREIARGVFDCLGRLSQSRRLAVSLYLNGCTVPEAAAHLRWRLKRTESLVYRGLAQLRVCLEAKGLKP